MSKRLGSNMCILITTWLKKKKSGKKWSEIVIMVGTGWWE